MSCDRAALAEITDSMRDTIRRDVAAGFRDDDDIATSAAEVEATHDVGLDVLEPIARELVREAAAAHAREAAGWPAVTDCDRLDAAFAKLDERGIVARQDFSCCGNCGHAEIWDEVQEARDAGAEVRGYAFYHSQDTDSAVEGDGVYLKYSATVKGGEAAEAVARELVEVLTAHGLATTWNGQSNQCVEVRLDWKRRRPASVG